MALESMKLCCHFIGSNVKKYYIQLQDCLGLYLHSSVSSELTMLDALIKRLVIVPATLCSH